jgi:hypothetical protein
LSSPAPELSKEAPSPEKKEAFHGFWELRSHEEAPGESPANLRRTCKGNHGMKKDLFRSSFANSEEALTAALIFHWESLASELGQGFLAYGSLESRSFGREIE